MTYCCYHVILTEEMTDPKTMSEENLHIELLQTFNPELALAAYIPLTSIFGRYINLDGVPISIVLSVHECFSLPTWLVHLEVYLIIAPLWKSGAILDSPCPSVIP